MRARFRTVTGKGKGKARKMLCLDRNSGHRWMNSWSAVYIDIERNDEKQNKPNKTNNEGSVCMFFCSPG